MSEARKISEAEYHAHCAQDAGYCARCREWTRDCTEPDAREYDCPQCEKRAVYGTEEALMMGLVEVE